MILKMFRLCKISSRAFQLSLKHKNSKTKPTGHIRLTNPHLYCQKVVCQFKTTTTFQCNNLPNNHWQPPRTQFSYKSKWCSNRCSYFSNNNRCLLILMQSEDLLSSIWLFHPKQIRLKKTSHNLGVILSTIRLVANRRSHRCSTHKTVIKNQT
jgi:hypothetical protein